MPFASPILTPLFVHPQHEEGKRQDLTPLFLTPLFLLR
uniref:Spore membrane protein involved in germination n=1 Tax=mine drainage metagenome TaxID=410659 RepID=E6QPZ8_9ZZZZ